jgi:hypothetical protein
MTVARGPWDVTLAIAAVALAFPFMLGNRTPDVMIVLVKSQRTHF